ncbi:MAG: hypothetical protein P8X55_15170 [Desulfosarcinaceae bacterium]
MDRSPLYYRPGKKTNGSELFRNCWCPDYDTCLEKAAREDLFLDCTLCLHRDNIVEEFAIIVSSTR